MILIFGTTVLTVFLYMVILYFLAQWISNNAIADTGWGMGFVLITLSLIFLSDKILPSMMVLSLMILVWGIRLSFFIYLRSLGKPEDFRYANWRKEWGKRQPWIAFYKVFMLQGAIMLVVSSPVILVFLNPSEKVTLTAWAGVLIFLTGFIIEILADSQMKRFRSLSSNKGKIISTGVWKYSRHPNYFGESLLWWGIGIYSLAVSGNILSLVSPLIITLLLRFVSGVPMLEEKYRDREDFREYARKTPVFIPFIGRKSIPGRNN